MRNRSLFNPDVPGNSLAVSFCTKSWSISFFFVARPHKKDIPLCRQQITSSIFCLSPSPHSTKLDTTASEMCSNRLQKPIPFNSFWGASKLRNQPLKPADIGPASLELLRDGRSHPLRYGSKNRRSNPDRLTAPGLPARANWAAAKTIKIVCSIKGIPGKMDFCCFRCGKTTKYGNKISIEYFF